MDFREFWRNKFDDKFIVDEDIININNKVEIYLDSYPESFDKRTICLLDMRGKEVLKCCNPVDTFKKYRRFSTVLMDDTIPHIDNLFLQIADDKILCVRNTMLNTWESFDAYSRITNEEFLEVCRYVYKERDYLPYINSSTVSIESVTASVKFGVRDSLLKKLTACENNIEELKSGLELLDVFGKEYREDEVTFYNKYSKINKEESLKYSKNLKKFYGGDFIEENYVRAIITKTRRVDNKLEKELQELMNALDRLGGVNIDNLKKLIDEETRKTGNIRAILYYIEKEDIQKILKHRFEIKSW